MILTKINLVNFRNYYKCNIKFNSKINIFIGNNAQGKTNILESVYVLALTKSYRTNYDEILKRNGSDSYKIKGQVKIGKYFKDLSISVINNEKKVFVNDTNIKKISDYVSNLNVILFSPEDVETIKGSPSLRRDLLNIEISQLNQQYIKNYNEYNKILKMRNDYLKLIYTNSISDIRYLDVLTDNLVDRATYIYKERLEFIKKINFNISVIYRDLTKTDNLKVRYETNIDIEDKSEEEIKKILLQKYQKNQNREIIAGMTLFGPHRDDFHFLINDSDIKVYGSQGQQKMAMISFKLAEIPIFEEITNTKPILLLDDIFSELDKTKRNRLINYINNDIQVIITANDTVGINKKLLENAKIFKIDNGKIIDKGDYNGRK
ncbi:MAG: DNA replication/repair protein RecF [Bacilli bacterium]|nr:DNA replication/repair protein RecF [Bacilli bacterium]